MPEVTVSVGVNADLTHAIRYARTMEEHYRAVRLKLEELQAGKDAGPRKLRVAELDLIEELIADAETAAAEIATVIGPAEPAVQAMMNARDYLRAVRDTGVLVGPQPGFLVGLDGSLPTEPRPADET